MIIKSTSIVAFINFISRGLGLVRSILFAYFLGTTLVADAFTIAFKIPNLLRRLVGEGSLTASFIPVFSEVQEESNNKEDENHFLSVFFSSLSLILLFIVILGISLTPFLVKFLYQFGDESPKAAIFLTRAMFPYIAFVSLAAGVQCVLNSNFKFALSASTAIMLNISIISSAILLTPKIPITWVSYCFPDFNKIITSSNELQLAFKAAISLTIGVLTGGLLQFLIQLPLFFKLGYRIKASFNWKNPHLLKVGKLMVPGIFAMGIYQINALVADPFVLAHLPNGSVAALNYSNRLLEFGLGIFVISLATVMLPNLSKYSAQKKWKYFKDILQDISELIIFLSLPASIGLYLLRDPIVTLLFNTGLFQKDSIQLVSNALKYHSFGLLPIGLYRIYAPAFYAMKDTKTPVIGAGLSLIVNLLLCAILPPIMGIGGIALASTSAALSNAIFLFILLKSRNKERFTLTFPVKTFLLSLLCTALMGIIVTYSKGFLLSDTSKISLLINLPISILLGIISYLLFTWVFQVKALNTILNKNKKKS